MGRCWGKGHGTPEEPQSRPPEPPGRGRGPAVLPAHPLQVPGSAGTPLCRACLHSRRAHSQEGAAPVPEGPPPRGACGPSCPPGPHAPPPPNPGAPWSHRRPHGCHFCLLRVPGEAVLPEGGGWGWVSQEAPEGLPAPRRGVSVPGGRGRVVLWQGWGSGCPCSEPGLVLVGSGADSLGLFSPRPPVPVCSCPLLSSCPRPLPTLPRICWASCLAGPGALLAPRTCSLDPEPQLGACSDPALLSPAGSGEQWSLPALLSEGRGSPGLEPVRLALGWHFLSPPPPSLAEAGRELVGVPQLPSGGPGRGGRRRVLEGFLEEGARAVGGCWLGECPPSPRGSPGSSAWPCSSSHTALTGSSPPQEAACACTMGTVSDFADCNLSPLPRALQSLLCSGC